MGAELVIVGREISTDCPQRGCMGLIWRVHGSRLEDNLGQPKYRCDRCGALVKWVKSRSEAGKRNYEI